MLGGLLHEACYRGDDEAVAELLPKADLLATDFDGWTALHWVCCLTPLETFYNASGFVGGGA